LDLAGVSGLKEPVKGAPGARTVLEDECSATKSRAKFDGSAWTAPDSTPVASGWLTDLLRWIFER
jgi:hypothetical protein